MSTFIVNGWNPGFNKVSMNTLLRKELGYSLGDAKQAVDNILDGKKVSLSVPSELSVKFEIELVQLHATFETIA